MRPGDDAASLHSLSDAEHKEYTQDLREYDAWCEQQEKEAANEAKKNVKEKPPQQAPWQDVGSGDDD